MPEVVLFLDFDGVLNGDRFLRHQRNHPGTGDARLFDPINLAALDQLCVRVPVQRIVVTSTWRLGRSLAVLRAMLASEGFEHADRIVDVTPNLGAGIRSRATEIATWIALHGPVRALVIDDCELGLSEGFFRTDGYDGLTLAIVADIVRWSARA